MGWFASPEGDRGFFSDDQCVPQDWVAIPSPDEPRVPPAAVEAPPAPKSARKRRRGKAK
jgi:hypothetical protein